MAIIPFKKEIKNVMIKILNILKINLHLSSYGLQGSLGFLYFFQKKRELKVFSKEPVPYIKKS